MGMNNAFYVVAVSNYIDSQYGEPNYPDNWCVSTTTYCFCSNIKKVRRFKTYSESQNYIDSIKQKYRKDRDFFIMYAFEYFNGGVRFYPVSSNTEAKKIERQITQEEQEQENSKKCLATNGGRS